MKTNFKKLAILAGATAAMAAGSMSAQAVITSVPAPAQLIPLFYYNSTAGVDTAVKVIVPKSVGADTVINLLAGAIPPSTSWSTTTAALPSKIHYFVMNYQSKEVINGAIPVTGDDEVYIEAGDFSGLSSGTPYYLILTNESAYLGGAPTFQFNADAWIENDAATGTTGLPATVYIPVLGLADTADTTTTPTPLNNVIENFPTSAGGPIASPIHTAIRTSSTTPGLIYRVVDVPVHDTVTHSNTLIAWADRNATSSLVNGLSGKLYSVDRDEVLASLGTYSFPNQLNIVKLGYTGTNPLGITDSYA
ncbi:MAG: hypothetical protein EB012_11560, partial [Gammaproteobacteria bacterium]|nr:hypothetical protein [Gammaproteobacteria bacterium]